MSRTILLVLVLSIGGACVVGLIYYGNLRGNGTNDPGPALVDNGPDDPSIAFDELPRGVGRVMVQNGISFDKASVDIEKYKKIAVPDDAEVRTEGGDSRLRIFMEKTLSFGGHPPEPMSIRTARNNMGCATKEQDGMLVLSTFGEWTSKEGGANMRVVLVVPARSEVEKRAKLSGPGSAGNKWNGQFPKPKEGYWYGPATPGSGWTAVPDVPDADRKAGK